MRIQKHSAMTPPNQKIVPDNTKRKPTITIRLIIKKAIKILSCALLSVFVALVVVYGYALLSPLAQDWDLSETEIRIPAPDKNRSILSSVLGEVENRMPPYINGKLTITSSNFEFPFADNHRPDNAVVGYGLVYLPHRYTPYYIIRDAINKRSESPGQHGRFLTEFDWIEWNGDVDLITRRALDIQLAIEHKFEVVVEESILGVPVRTTFLSVVLDNDDLETRSSFPVFNKVKISGMKPLTFEKSDTYLEFEKKVRPALQNAREKGELDGDVEEVFDRVLKRFLFLHQKYIYCLN